MAKSNYEIVKAWRKANPDKVAAQSRRYRAKHYPELKARQYRWRQKNIDHARSMDAAAAVRRRRADPEGNRRRIAKFKARKRAERELIAGRSCPPTCEVCGELNIRIVFDHCHASGLFRGWICDRCNRVLGLVNDRPALLCALAGYLVESNGKVNDSEAQQNPDERLCGAGQIVSGDG